MANSMIDKLLSKELTENEDNKTVPDFKIGDVIAFSNTGVSYRIVSLIDDEVQLVQMNINSINIKAISKDYLNKLLDRSEIQIQQHEDLIVDEDKIDFKIREAHDLDMKIAIEMQKYFKNDYIKLKTQAGTHFAKAQMTKYGIGKTKVWKIYRRFLQSGFDTNALYDQRILSRDLSSRIYHNKTGRKPKYSTFGKNLTDNDIKNIDSYIKKYKSNIFSSVSSCYKDMLGKYYTEYIREEDGSTMPVLLPASEIPSINQFRYRLNKVITEEEKSLIRAKRKDVSEGNNSLNDSDFLFDIHGPTTVVEMDEQEMDLSAVSYFDPSLAIGRFILHVIIDVQSKLVMAISVSLDNNSVVGATHCLMNLAEDHVEFCKKYGVEIKPEAWPSGNRVNAIRVDRGSEYMSKEFARICQENSINLIPTPARTASRKGTVEKQFSIFGAIWKDILAEYGLISKLHDSNHHEKAVLDYYDIMKICISNVLAYNMSEIENFKRSKEMLSQKILCSPINLWNYYNSKYHTVHPIGNKNAFMYSLMTPTTCYISKNGVRWEGLWYQYNDTDIDDLRWKGNHHKMEVRMDRRDVSHLYYIKDNKLMLMTLNPKKTYNMDFKDMPYEIYMKYRKIQKELEAHAREQNIAIDVANRILVKSVLTENKRDTYANIQNMSENRIAEKNLIKSENTMHKALSSEMKTEEKTMIERNQKDRSWPSWDEISDHMSDEEKDFILD